MLNDSLTVYIIVVLCLGAVLIMSREKVPPKLKRGMALLAVVLILLAFIMVVYTLLSQ
ncbi:hypothetical protein ACE6ED_27305 [Paenibacillus sp. CN-4]|uniref:hypothetical protein n=1 Tax=Paenibacillus nanchangensis TaxID=3348343 RepID=UPI0039796520